MLVSKSKERISILHTPTCTEAPGAGQGGISWSGQVPDKQAWCGLSLFSFSTDCIHRGLRAFSLIAIFHKVKKKSLKRMLIKKYYIPHCYM